MTAFVAANADDDFLVLKLLYISCNISAVYAYVFCHLLSCYFGIIPYQFYYFLGRFLRRFLRRFLGRFLHTFYDVFPLERHPDSSAEVLNFGHRQPCTLKTFANLLVATSPCIDEASLEEGVGNISIARS